MKTYIALLRGVNVSGKNKLPMKELKALFDDLGYKNSTTYIQSGNVVFGSDENNQQTLSKQISDKIKDVFGFDVPVIIRTVDELDKANTGNPYLKQAGLESDKMYITLLADEPIKENIDKANGYNYEPDTFIIAGKTAYIYAAGGYGNTKLNNTFFENKLKVKATTRNLKTMNELIRMGKEL